MERKLWVLLYRIASKDGNPWGSWRYSDAEILGIYFWAVIHDRPTVWAVDRAHWPDDLRPSVLPAQSTLSRRLRNPNTVNLMTTVEQSLLGLVIRAHYLVQVIDGKALPVSKISKDKDLGYGRGAGVHQTGYKLHAVWSRGPMPLAWALTPMNSSEKKMARALIPSLAGGGYLLGDSQFDANVLYDLAGSCGFQLVACKTNDRGRGGLGHRRQSPFRLRSIALLKTRFGRNLIRQRGSIERSFGRLTSFGGGLSPLPAWVRRFPRVRNWVQAKILIAGARWLVQHPQTELALA